MNPQYVIVQLTANMTDSRSVQAANQSTYVFTRGSRTYLNAFAVLPNFDINTYVDMNIDKFQIMVIESNKINIYQISTPKLAVIPRNPDLYKK